MTQPLQRRTLLKRASILALPAAPALSALIGAPAIAQPLSGTLRFGDQANQIRSMMEGAGQLKDVPYKIEFANFPNAGPVLEAEKAGALDAGFGGDGAHCFAFANGLPGKVIYAERSDPACIAVLVHGDSPIKTVKDLKGKSVAIIRGSIVHYLIANALAANGMKAEDVNLVFMQSADAKSAFYGKSVDGWGTWTLLQAQAVLNDKARVLVNGRGLINNNAFISANDTAIASKQAILQDFANRFGRSRVWALNNLDAYSKVWSDITKASPEVCKHAYNLERFRPVAFDEQLLDEWRKTANFYKGAGLLTNAFDPAKVVDNRFKTDAHLLDEAKKLA
jgi:sulfonate transport system substrate-binding protein